MNILAKTRSFLSATRPAAWILGASIASHSLLGSAQDAPPKALPTKPEPMKAFPTKAKPIRDAKPSPTPRPLSVTVALTINAVIEGTLTDTTQLQMQTSFGTASIPLSEVAGIRFASADDATTTVVMLNGDSITGAIDLKLITVETEWGTASVNGTSIASLMFVPGLKWSARDGLNGKRWSLADQTGSTASASTPPSTAPLPSPSTTIRRSSATSPIQSGRFSNGQFFPGR
ncbi:MAG: hypothetical protein AAGJ40_15045 [Planctomycetota bacterium]